MASTPPEKISDVQDEHSSVERGDGPVNSHANTLAQFDKDAERKLRTKIDWAIVPIVSVLYLFCFIDRANIGNARLAGLEADLGMKGYDYNTLLSVFYISYILFEIPSTVACKWMGPGRFIPLLAVLFGVVSICTAFVQNLSQACGVRFVLGIFEAGMMPCISYYLSRWYRRSELAFRLSLFIVMAPLAGAFGGLLASGILSLNSFGSLRTWRMLFAIEGIITSVIAIISFFILADRPETAKWLSEEEKALAIARVQSERVAQTKVLDQMGKQKLWLGFWNPMVLSTAFVFLLNNITIQGLAFFTPTIVASIYPTYTTVQKQLYSVPPFVVGAFFEVLLPLLSWRFDKRQIFIIISTPMVMVGYIMFLATNDATTRYAATFLTASSCFAVGALANAQASAFVSSDTSRSISLAVNMMGGNIGGLIATWSYLPWDAPNYRIGNGLNLAASGLILLVSLLSLLWMIRDNKRRDGLDAEEQLRGLSEAEIESLEWKHPGWRWYP